MTDQNQQQYPSPFPSMSPPGSYSYTPQMDHQQQVPAPQYVYNGGEGPPPMQTYPMGFSPQPPPQQAVYPMQGQHQVNVPMQSFHPTKGSFYGDDDDDEGNNSDTDIKLDDERRPPHLLDPSDVKSDVSKWLREGWHLFIANWVTIIGFELCYMFIFILLQWASHVFEGTFLEIPLIICYWLLWPFQYGFIIAGMEMIRKKERARVEGVFLEEPPRMELADLFRGHFLYFPLLWINILYGLVVLGGLLCLIIPGIYFLFTFAFAPMIYIEYHKQRNAGNSTPYSYGIIDSFTISRNILHGHFCNFFAFVILCLLINFAGALVFGIGTLVTMPVCALAFIVAFNDLFSIQPYRQPDNTCYCCC